MRAVIIGAGIFGASTAYHLAREGAEVLVLDAVHPGKATLAGAGIACPWVEDDTDADRYRLCMAGARYHREILARLDSQFGTDIGFAPVGALVLGQGFLWSDLICAPPSRPAPRSGRTARRSAARATASPASTAAAIPSRPTRSSSPPARGRRTS